MYNAELETENSTNAPEELAATALEIAQDCLRMAKRKHFELALVQKLIELQKVLGNGPSQKSSPPERLKPPRRVQSDSGSRQTQRVGNSHFKIVVQPCWSPEARNHKNLRNVTRK